MKILYVAFIVVTVTGCVASGDPITLRHPITGQVTKCPGYSRIPAQAAFAEMQQRNCVQDYQRQGYERAPQ
jgi:hypothetical protein